MIVTHRITVGADAYASPDSSRLVHLRVRASILAPVKYAVVTLAPAEGLSLSPDDDFKIELGVDRASSRVFSGKIARVEWGFDGVRVLAESKMARMTATRVNLAFEKQSAGDIVSALCRAAKVSTGQIDPGLKFPAYTVSHNQSAYDHAKRLALQCGFDFYADPDDKAVFAKSLPTGQPRLLQYGSTILSVSVEKPREGIGEVLVFGESPASFGKGDDAAPWLTKRAVKGSAPATGSGDITLQTIEPALRTQQTTQQMARNLQTALKSHIVARLRLVGTPDVHLNELVQLSQMPNRELNGSFKVTGVEHLIQKGIGFVTMLDLVAV